MLLNAHFLRRQAARERKAAASAVTEAARVRHLGMAVHYLERAEQLQSSEQPLEREATSA